MISHVGRRAVAANLANAAPTSPGFHQIKTAVAAQFQRMSAHELFRTDVEKDALWTTYLSNFPDGTNPIMRKRTEHDCSCCRQFVRAIGNVVAIIDGKLTSVWDIDIGNPTYEAVSAAMSDLVKAAPIDNRFLHTEGKVGTDRNFEDGENGVKTWEHFFVTLPNSRVCKGTEIGPRLSEARALHDVLLRSLTELTIDATDTVLELIAANDLYRGEEHKHAVAAFRKIKAEFDGLTDDRDNFAWQQSTTLPGSVSKIRNTSIGTLLTELSEGMDVEKAVARFEAMVAPANYKRPTALVTPSMVAKAKATVEELGLTAALDRRYARLTDITVNNILFADRSARKVMEGGTFDGIATTSKPKSFDKAEEVGIEVFLTDILPKAESLEVLIENRHAGNLVSLVAPVDPKAAMLFKWDNGFSWSYNGDIADSDIRRAVQARGGRVDGVFRFSHSWNHQKRNASLMDLHVFMPGNGTRPTNDVHDAYGNTERVGWNHRNHHASGGIQDVDYVAEAPAGYVPVENTTFPTLARMPEGLYICKIHNWQLRQPTQGGFRAEIEFGGTVFQYEYDKPLKHKEWVTVAEVTLKDGAFTIKHHLPESSSTKTIWGMQTQEFHRANVVMLSPNHWDGHGVGNRHYFFMLDGCQNDGTARGFYNEFLRGDLDQHRKVLEIVGAKMRTDETANQLSGLGFSTTQRNHVIVRVKSRAYKIMF